MLLKAVPLQLGNLACKLAALLSERDILRGPSGWRNADLRLRLDVLHGQHDHAAGATVEVIVGKLLDIATADWRDLVEVKMNPKTGETISVRMDLSTQERALEFLGKCHGLGTEQVDVNLGFVPKRIIGVNLDDL